jgi:dihydroorotase
VAKDGTLKPFVSAARQRGVLFDVGHGGGSFFYAQAVPALKQGFLPDSISTDLHTGSMNSGMKDLTNVMSKFLALGLSVPDVVLRTTWNPARTLKRTDFGHLDVGVDADIAVMSLRQGQFGFVDVDGKKKTGTQKLDCELTVRAGKIVWDLNGISKPEFQE